MQAISKHTTPRVRTIRWRKEWFVARGIRDGEFVKELEDAFCEIRRQGGSFHGISSRDGLLWEITWPTQKEGK